MSDQTDLSDMNPLPEWLAPPSAPSAPSPPPPSEVAKLRRKVTHMTYENMFDHVLEDVASGNPLKAVLDMDNRPIDYASYLRWIKKDEERTRRYHEALEVAAEVVASQMLSIADAEDSIEDVARSTLRINTRKWMLGVWSRDRFGEKRVVDQNVTIDFGAAIEEASRRVADLRSRARLRDDMRTIDAE